MAGFVGSQQRWLELEGDWRKALDCWGLDSFHMTDFESYYRNYSNWTRDQHRDRLNHLLDLISSHTMGYIGFGLSIQAYERALAEDMRDKLTAYHVLAFCCFRYGSQLLHEMTDVFRQISADLDTPPDLLDFPTAFVYDEVGKGRGALQETYERIASVGSIKQDLHVVSLSYQSKRNLAALQAADILAYELWKDIPRSLGLSQRPKRYPMRRIEEFSRSVSWHFYDEEQLRAMAPSLATLFNMDG